jgi:hypothetical protein
VPATGPALRRAGNSSVSTVLPPGRRLDTGVRVWWVLQAGSLTLLIAPRLRRLTALVAVIIPVAVLLFAVGSPTNAGAATAPGLGNASSYAVLGGQTVTNTGPSTIDGDLGVWPGTSVTNFPPGIVTGGTIHSGDSHAQQAQSAVTTAYDALSAEPCTDDLTGQDLGGMTLTAGVYCFTSSAQLTGLLTLDAEGSANAVFIFKTVSTLTTASSSVVDVINGGVDCNVFWRVGSSAPIGTGTVFAGNILALTTITLATGASVSGRALARNGEVTLQTNHIGFLGCGASTATASPTASPIASAAPTGTATASAAPTATPVGQTPTPTATPVGQTPTPVGQTPTPTATPVGQTPTPVGQTPTPHITACCLPRTGGPSLETNGFWWPLLPVALVMGSFGAMVLVLSLLSPTLTGATVAASRKRDNE